MARAASGRRAGASGPGPGPGPRGAAGPGSTEGGRAYTRREHVVRPGAWAAAEGGRGLRRGFAAERGAPALPPWPWPAASRRTALKAALVAGLSVLAPEDGGGAAAAAEAGMYEDARSGFAVAPPPAWERTDKQGATAYFIDLAYKFNNLGITVLPSRVDTLEKFGSLDFAADRLMGVEKAKDSVQEATLLGSATRTGDSGILFYDFDFLTRSNYGAKRVFCSVTIARKQLYIVNGQIFCKDRCQVPNPDLDELAKSVKSFDILLA